MTCPVGRPRFLRRFEPVDRRVVRPILRLLLHENIDPSVLIDVSGDDPVEPSFTTIACANSVETPARAASARILEPNCHVPALLSCGKVDIAVTINISSGNAFLLRFR